MEQKAGSPTQEFLEKVITLQQGLIARATGAEFDNTLYRNLRRELMGRADLSPMIPRVVQRCRDLAQFWDFIQPEYPTYRQRRVFLRDEFRPLIDYLESLDTTPGVTLITDALKAFDPEHVHAIWQKALARRKNDPEGAITAARTLLESVCKYILDDAGVAYSEGTELPKLWNLAAETLNLAPSQHQEEIFKSILGNCQSVVNNLAAIRNRAGDAHGRGRKQIKPKARHAELAVNLAGIMACFLVTTWKEKSVSKAKI